MGIPPGFVGIVIGLSVEYKQLILLLLLLLLLLLMQFSCHSVAAVLTPVQTKQIRINVHKRNNTKAKYKQYKIQ